LSGKSESALSTADRAKYKRLVLEAKSIIGTTLGAVNEFALPLAEIASPPSFGFLSRPSVEDLHEAIALIEGGLNQLRRKSSRVPARPGAVQKPTYVSPQRILQLRNAKPGQWDFRKLVRMLEELNLANEHDAYVSTAMLVRAIIDHVPPIFGAKTFTEVANNHPGGRSFGEQIKHLDVSLRKVADALLHQQIRKAESLPLAPQVDFRAALDVLLGEVVRVGTLMRA
jgi:hypothetical protein